MITKKDRQYLIQDMTQVFATKDDISAMEGRQDKKFATKDDLKKALNPVNRKLNKIVKYFDRDIIWHNRRLKHLEEKVGFKTPEYVSLPLM